MINYLAIFIGKLISFISQILNFGNGSTWPGHVALLINKNFIKDILVHQEAKKHRLKIVLIAGTNGKTTTGKLIKTILEKSNLKVYQNEAGANLLNGIASSILLHSSILSTSDYEYAIFEIDENALPLILKEIIPDYLILLNLFRDQLDRYGEVNIIAEKWQKALSNLNVKTKLILNADDPQIAYLGYKKTSNVFYFGLDDPSLSQKSHQHAADSTSCPNCTAKLNYKSVYYSHLGNWLCPNCRMKRPKLSVSKTSFYPIKGAYNKYNTNAAVLFAKLNNINNERIQQSLRKFKPAFGRQETLRINGKQVRIFLSKNPTSLNESLRTVLSENARHFLFVLNDRIPDGRDISWIWDVDFEAYLDTSMDVSAAGDRAFDMAVRLKYTHPKVTCVDTYFPYLDKGIDSALSKVGKNETLYILPTYSAMLEVRKILTGRKIL